VSGIERLRRSMGIAQVGRNQYWRTLWRPKDGDVIHGAVFSGARLVACRPQRRQTSAEALKARLAILQPRQQHLASGLG